MISILIPIHNDNVVELVLTIKNLADTEGIPYEIMCYDDCSSPEYRATNSILRTEIGVSYIELENNLGRSKIRNRMGKYARFDHLLFIDGDSKIPGQNYLRNYLDNMQDHRVIFGGRIYNNTPPDIPELGLHWKYGSKREALPLASRLKHPYRSFQTNNFMVLRSLLEDIPFDEGLTQYGYEDLLWAEKVKNEGIPIHHIENPLIHMGLESYATFLNKTKLAAENLAALYFSEQLSDTRMLQFYRSLKKIGFNSFLHNIIRRKLIWIETQLRKPNPNLLLFDFFRLFYFHQALIDLKASSS